MKKIILVSLSLFICSIASGQRSIPELWGLRVHDEAGVLSTQAEEQLEAQLKQHEDSTSNQIAILIIPSLEGEIIEEYSLRVAEKWQLGQKGTDNGVLLLIAIDDREMRIEVGYGLEGPLPDITCAQIIRNEMAPNFRRGDYEAGVQAAINAIIGAIAGEYTVREEIMESMEMTTGEKIMIGLFVFGILGLFTVMGLFIKGAGGWVLYFFLIPFYAIFPSVIYGWGAGKIIIIGYLVVYPILKIIFGRMGWSKLESKGGSGGGWSSGSGWSSGGGGWSSGGGGGFSGGGGSFGGGGSSGGW